MTVEELIKELEKYPKNMEVLGTVIDGTGFENMTDELDIYTEFVANDEVEDLIIEFINK